MKRSTEHATDRAAEIREPGVLASLRAGDARISDLVMALASITPDANHLAVREQLIRCICNAVSSQRAAEEDILYPAMLNEHPKLVFALLLADQGLSMRIAELRNPVLDRFERELALIRLIRLVRLNMQERRQALFPVIEREFSSTSAESVAAAFCRRNGRQRDADEHSVPAERDLRAACLV